MAQAFTTVDGITLIDPGTYVSTTVQSGQSAIAGAGVVTLIGEADQGPGFLDEADLSANVYDPTQYGSILQKYKSGRIVDAFAKLISAANDGNILGSVSQVRIVKTNMSAKASGSLKNRIKGNPEFASALAKSEGAPGNLLQYKSDVAQAELAPSTGAFVYAPAISGSIPMAIRANGGNLLSFTIAAKAAPDALATSLSSVALGILTTGGHKKLVLPASALALTVTAQSATVLLVTLAPGSLWANSPVVGDVAVIPLLSDYGAAQNSSIAGTAQANAGTYIVTAVSNTVSSATLSLQKVSTSGTLISTSGSSDVDLTDIILYSQMQIQNLSGDDRLFMQDVFGTYNVLLNTGSQIQIQSPSALNITPKAGDIIKIPALFSTVQPGFYQVTAGTSTTFNATRLSEGSSGSGAGSAVYASGVEPLQLLGPVLSGAGKTLSIEGTVSSIFLTSSGQNAGLSNSRLISSTEYINQITITNGNLSSTFKGGGDIVLEIGCDLNNATVHVAVDRIDFLINAVVSFSATFKQFVTMSDLAKFISSNTDWSASVPAAKFNAATPSNLDMGTYGVSGLASLKNGRIKQDSFSWEQSVNGSGLVSWIAELPGLPEPMDSVKFLSGGAKNGTTSALAVAAIDACQVLDTNFLVPLFSVNASEDIANDATESSSTYAIDAINSYMSSHVLFMSQIEMRKNRQAVVSKRAAYKDVKEAAGEIANFRIGMAFQDVKTNNILYQPWMAAIVAVGMQVAAGYKGIVKKFANINGISKSGGDWSSVNPGDRKDALKTGLLFLESVRTGGFRWVSDQTTYSLDNNFVYNSLQAIYISDLITLDLIDTFDRKVVGQSISDVSAAGALSILEANMFNYKRLRWIASSDDAVKGYKNASAKFANGAMVINAEIKLAGLIYFVPISLLVSEVTQTAIQ